MTGFRPARDDARYDGITEWMEHRLREIAARGPDAELAGRAAWARGNLSGEHPYAPRPGDVVTLGAHVLNQGSDGVVPRGGSAVLISRTEGATQPVAWAPPPAQARPMTNRRASTTAPASVRQSSPQDDKMARFYREQAAFMKGAHEEANRDSWMAIPALAPIAAVLLAEGAGLLGARLVGSRSASAPLNFFEREHGLATKATSPRASQPARPVAKPRSDAEENALRRPSARTICASLWWPSERLGCLCASSCGA
jgi:hypothetical protein